MNHKYVSAFSIISQHWDGNEILPCITLIYTMVVDDLVIKGAEAMGLN